MIIRCSRDISLFAVYSSFSRVYSDQFVAGHVEEIFLTNFPFNLSCVGFYFKMSISAINLENFVF